MLRGLRGAELSCPCLDTVIGREASITASTPKQLLSSRPYVEADGMNQKAKGVKKRLKKRKTVSRKTFLAQKGERLDWKYDKLRGGYNVEFLPIVHDIGVEPPAPGTKWKIHN